MRVEPGPESQQPQGERRGLLGGFLRRGPETGQTPEEKARGKRRGEVQKSLDQLGIGSQPAFSGFAEWMVAREEAALPHKLLTWAEYRTPKDPMESDDDHRIRVNVETQHLQEQIGKSLAGNRDADNLFRQVEVLFPRERALIQNALEQERKRIARENAIRQRAGEVQNLLNELGFTVGFAGFAQWIAEREVDRVPAGRRSLIHWIAAQRGINPGEIEDEWRRRMDQETAQHQQRLGVILADNKKATAGSDLLRRAGALFPADYQAIIRARDVEINIRQKTAEVQNVLDQLGIGGIWNLGGYARWRGEKEVGSDRNTAFLDWVGRNDPQGSAESRREYAQRLDPEIRRLQREIGRSLSRNPNITPHSPLFQLARNLFGRDYQAIEDVLKTEIYQRLTSLLFDRGGQGGALSESDKAWAGQMQKEFADMPWAELQGRLAPHVELASTIVRSAPTGPVPQEQADQYRASVSQTRAAVEAYLDQWERLRGTQGGYPEQIIELLVRARVEPSGDLVSRLQGLFPREYQAIEEALFAKLSLYLDQARAGKDPQIPLAQGSGIPALDTDWLERWEQEFKRTKIIDRVKGAG